MKILGTSLAFIIGIGGLQAYCKYEADVSEMSTGDQCYDIKKQYCSAVKREEDYKNNHQAQTTKELNDEKHLLNVDVIRCLNSQANEPQRGFAQNTGKTDEAKQNKNKSGQSKPGKKTKSGKKAKKGF